MACCNGNALCIVPGNDMAGHPCRTATPTEFMRAVEQERAGQKGVTTADLRVAAEWAVEERLAWDRYAAALLTACDAAGSVDHEIETTYAADGADDMLAKRRERFGGPSK